ncbi:MAG TPA: hypothetical protein VFZ91_05265 [Allosphingosinicella sp.]
MTGSWGRPIAAALVLLALLPGAAAAKEKVKRERTRLALPIVVETAGDAPDRVHSFRTGQLWGTQPARYRSAVTVEAPVTVPEKGEIGVILPGTRLVELQATSKAFTGSLYCRTLAMGRKQRPALVCLADRDGDGAMDQLWAGAAASLEAVVPFPDIRSLTPIEPVRYRPVTDPASLALQIGFYVSGKNPLLGQHHFYAALGVDGTLAYVLHESHKAVTMADLPKSVSLGGGEIRVKGYAQGTYQAEVTRPLPAGERLVVSPYPTQTIFVYVPG